MDIERVPNRNSPPHVLLRQSYREDGKVRKRNLANLSKLPDDAIEGLRILLKGGSAIDRLESAFELQRSLPHGHVAAVLGTLKNIGQSLISDRATRQRDASHRDAGWHALSTLPQNWPRHADYRQIPVTAHLVKS